MRVLVTGGAGFIGSAVARELLAAGHEVRVLDDLSTGKRENLPEDPRLEFAEGSILDDAALASAVSGVDAVAHQAAMVSVPLSFEDPDRCALLNVEGTRRVLAAAKAAGARRAAIASSAAVYGDAPPVPTDERAPAAPLSPYGRSKLDAEAVAAELSSPDFKVVALRYFNVIGPRQALAGGYPALVPPLALAAARRAPFTLFGDGLQTRDLVAVRDVARANRLALEAQFAGSFAALNIGTGVERSVRDVIRAVGEVAGAPVEVREAPPRPGDIRRSASDPSLAAATIGWRAEVAFADAVAETFSFYAALHGPEGAV
jgi:UDP-glucose 4-epimerase